MSNLPNNGLAKFNEVSHSFWEVHRLLMTQFHSRGPFWGNPDFGPSRQMLCFVPLGGPFWAMSDFDAFLHFLLLFFLFLILVSRARMWVWHKENVHPWRTCIVSDFFPWVPSYWKLCVWHKEYAHSHFFLIFLLMSSLTRIMSFTSVGIRFLKKTSQNSWKSDVEITNRVLR